MRQKRDAQNFDTETVTPDLVCVECGKHMDRTSGPGAPGPGDFALCIGCGSLNVFAHDMRFRLPTDDEMLAAAADADIQRTRRIILRVAAEPMTAPTHSKPATSA